MLSQSKLLSHLAVLAFGLPAVAFSAAATQIDVNGTCEFNCATSLTAGALTIGTSVSNTFSFGVTLGDGDTYTVTGSFGNTFLGSTHLGFYPTVTYTGATPSAAADTISVDMLQDFFFPGASVDWSGPYNEDLPIVLNAAGSTATGSVSYDGQTIGVLGPVTGPGTFPLSKVTNLSGLTGNTLVSDFNYTFTFPMDAPNGSFASSPVPEPSQTIPAALGLLGLLAILKTRKIRN